MIIKNIISKTLAIASRNTNINLLNSKFAAICLNSTFHQKSPKFDALKSNFSLSATKSDLMEFFEKKENINEEMIKHGRPWRVEELRIKSNTDIHKLWYVLHKERNMLLTMEEMYKKSGEIFPSPDRIAKVDESMENILTVVDERNIAYNLLESGESKKIISYRRYNSFGHIQKYQPREHLVPWFLNKQWKLKYHYKKLPFWSKHYRTLFRVHLRQERSKIKRRVQYAVKKLSRKHPDLDKEFVTRHFEEKYGFTKPLPYHQLIQKPKPSDVPLHISEREKFKNKNNDLL